MPINIIEEKEETIAPTLWQRVKKFLFGKVKREKKNAEVDNVRRRDQTLSRIKDRKVGDGGEIRTAYPPEGKPIVNGNLEGDSRPNIVYAQIKTVRQAARANRINRQLYGK